MRDRVSPLWFVLATALPLTAAPGAAAPLQPAEASPAERAGDEDAPSRRRILHLTSGQVARGVTRQQDGTWQLKRAGSWQSIPDAAISRVRDEREVLKDWRARTKEAGDDLAAQSASAGWAFENGLIEEAVAELDGVLEARPNHPRALAILGAHGHRIALPRPATGARADGPEVDALFDWASGHSRTLRELAWIELAGVRDREGIRARLKKDLASGVQETRLLACHALGRVAPGVALRGLLMLSVHDVSESVRHEAAIALGRAGEDVVAAPLVRALDSNDGHLRVRAIEALGYVGHPAAVAPIVTRLAAAQGAPAPHSVPHSHIYTGRQFAYVQDFDVEVARFQAAADPVVMTLVEGMVLDAGVRGIEEVQYVRMERVAARKALRRLTGASPGRSSDAWLKWWETEGAQWRAANLPLGPTRAD